MFNKSKNRGEKLKGFHTVTSGLIPLCYKLVPTHSTTTLWQYYALGMKCPREIRKKVIRNLLLDYEIIQQNTIKNLSNNDPLLICLLQYNLAVDTAALNVQ